VSTFGAYWNGLASQERRSAVALGMVARGIAGTVRQRNARYGPAPSGRSGTVRQGYASPGRSGYASYGGAGEAALGLSTYGPAVQDWLR
jgi:hypothetical protein